MLGPFLPRFFGGLACRTWFTTRRFKRPAMETAAANRADRSSLNVNGVDITVWSWGKGQPILFIHGWCGRGTQVAAMLQALLDAGYRVISFDAPAHGETAGKRTSMLEIADVVLALGKKYGPIHGTITRSLGGMVLSYACTRGFNTGCAVCLGPPATTDHILDRFQRALMIPDKVMDEMKNRLYASYGKDVQRRTSSLVNVKNLAIPALIIHDDKDLDIPWQDGRAVADAWPGAVFKLTRGLGHRRMLRDPDTIISVTEFIINS